MLTFVSTPQSFLVTGHEPSQVLVLRTGPSPGEVSTYQIQKLPGGEVPTPEFIVNSNSKFIIKNGQLYFQSISQIFPVLSAFITLVRAIITFFSDNFSSLLSGIPLPTLSFLQSILGTAAKVAFLSIRCYTFLP